MRKKAGEGNVQEKRGIPHLVGNIVGIVIIAVLLPIMAVNMTLIIKSYTQPDKVPTVFGVAPLIVMSGSMEPTIMVNDLIFTKQVDTAKLKTGDIIAFQPAGATTVVTHRIVEVLPAEGALGLRFRTKGDWNSAEDVDPVAERSVVGRYISRLEGVGKLALFLQQPVGMIVFVAIPLVLFLLYDLLRRYFYSKKTKGEKDADQEELERLRALAASLEAGAAPPAAPDAKPVFVPAPDIAAAYPHIEGEPEPPGEADLDEDDGDEV